jgi:uncharacterized membrane protein YeaQ/YmgE (transglycosylase-associated protein family)
MFNLIGFLIWGLIIGGVARLLKPGKQNLSVLATLGLGMVGSIIGGILASLISAGSIFELNFWGVVFAVIASVLLVGTAETLTSNKRKQIA